jgi:hypothetical protein
VVPGQWQLRTADANADDYADTDEYANPDGHDAAAGERGHSDADYTHAEADADADAAADRAAADADTDAADLRALNPAAQDPGVCSRLRERGEGASGHGGPRLRVGRLIAGVFAGSIRWGGRVRRLLTRAAPSSGFVEYGGGMDGDRIVAVFARDCGRALAATGAATPTGLYRGGEFYGRFTSGRHLPL